MVKLTNLLQRLVGRRSGGHDADDQRANGLRGGWDSQRTLERIERKLDQLEEALHGGRSTYLGGNRVLVKAVVEGRNIAYIVEADDRLLSPWFIVSGRYETDVTNFFVKELSKDSFCLDIGANFGYYTCLMARFCDKGRVLAVEAQRDTFELVRDNIHANGFGNIAQAVHAAVSDREGEMTLYKRNTRSGNTSIIDIPAAHVAELGETAVEPFSVASTTIDRLSQRLDGRVDFIKIDVEGAEPLALAGAKETIARNSHIVIVMEWSPNQLQAAGFDIPTFVSDLENTGLRFFDLQADGLHGMSASELVNLPYRGGVVFRRRR